MQLSVFCQKLFLGPTIEDKLCSFNNIEDLTCAPLGTHKKFPERSKNIEFSNNQIKFPKTNSFHSPEKRALALHFFANHELLAIEMFAWALLNFPFSELEKKSILETIGDEQKHFKLYTKRMKELGVNFGDYPINDFFWRTIQGAKTPEEFYALSALTFEQANLDFAYYYKGIFEKIGDMETARIMNTVYEDEIIHVARGRHYLCKKSENCLWDYFKELLPADISPARAKGIIFNKEARVKAGFENEYIKNIEEFRGDFIVTDRRQWK